MTYNPKTAVIVATNGHPGLISEALESAINQQFDDQYMIIIVIDGCPFQDTRIIVEAYSFVYDNILFEELPQSKGPGAARNRGIEIALAYDSIQSVIFLDSDDRLDPNALKNLNKALIEADDLTVGWVYTDPYQFGGLHGYMRKAHHYSALWHLAANVNSVSSLVSRKILEAGIRFDETFHASEDWDFWIAAIGAGFRGKFISGPSFYYRRRGGSRSVQAMKNIKNTQQKLQGKHESIYSTNFICGLASDEGLAPLLISWPGHQTIRVDNNCIAYPWSELIEKIREHSVYELSIIPDYLIFSDRNFFEKLPKSIKLGILTTARFMLQQYNAIALSKVYNSELLNQYSLSISLKGSSKSRGQNLTYFVSTRTLKDRKLLESVDFDKAPLLELAHDQPVPGGVEPVSAAEKFNLFKKHLFDGHERFRSSRPDLSQWRPPGFTSSNLLGTIAGSPVPHICAGLQESSPQVGVIYGPGLLEQFDPEQVQNILWTFSDRNDCHFFLMGDEKVQFSNELANLAKSITSLPLFGRKASAGRYMGARVPTGSPSSFGSTESNGLFGWLDLIVAINCGSLLNSITEIKNSQSRIVFVEKRKYSSYGNDLNNNFGPYISYESGIDYLITDIIGCDYLRSRGFPSEKLGSAPMHFRATSDHRRMPVANHITCSDLLQNFMDSRPTK